MNNKQKGFTLIEVMITLLILAVGILGISILQGTLVRNSSDANQRSIAMTLAQKKIDDLKSFVHLDADIDNDSTTADATWDSTDPLNEQSYAFIADNAGGTIASGNITIGNYTYTLTWDSEHWFYSTVGSTIASTAAATIDAKSNFKKVMVTVAWNDEVGDSQEVVLETVIDAYAPDLTALSDNSHEGGGLPRSDYTPGVAPEIIYTDVGDIDGETNLRRESTSPEITVSQNQQFVENSFNVITYNANNEIIKQEEFVHINCTCEQQATDSVTYLPASMELAIDDTIYVNTFDKDSADFKVDAGDKEWGARINTGPTGQQSSDCDICCRDHHDKTGPNNPDTLFDPFRPTGDYTSGDHNHYFPDGGGLLELANDDGDTYLEACLLVKVDGIFRVTQDMNIMTVKTMPESYLLGSGFLNYQDYKEDYLLAYAKQLKIAGTTTYPAQSLGPVGDSTPSIKYTLDNSVNLANEPNLNSPALSIGDTDNLRAKTLYARYIPIDLFKKITDVAVAGATWIEVSNLLPYYDPDSTIIAQTNEDTSAWGTDVPSQITVDQTGTLTALAATSVSGAIATATRTDSSTGFTNTRPIDINDEDDNYLTSDGMLVVVSGTSSSTPIDVKVTVTSSGTSGVSPNSVSVVGANGAVCGLEANNVKYVYICSFSGGSGKLVVSDYNDSYKVNPGNITVVVDNEVCLSGETITVANDGTLTETSTIIYSGLSGSVADKTVHIVKETAGC